MQEQDQPSTRKDNHRPTSLWMGLIFIIGGIAVLLNQFDLVPFQLNWWALFILLPAAGFLSRAYNHFRSDGDMFAMDVIVTALIGLFLLALSFSLLVGAAWNFDWSLLGPIILVIIGLGMIFGRARRG